MTRAILIAAALLVVAAILGPQPVMSHAVVDTTVSYDREIVRILRNKCLACHSASNLGIPLTTYEETRPWAGAIHEEALQKHMPPWRAVQGYGEFANDASLTSRELQFLIAWIDGKGPKSKDQHLVVNVEAGKTAESDRLTLDLTHWELGKPDLTRALPPNLVEPGQGDFVREVVVNVDVREDRRVRALEFKPGDRRVVRAAFFYLQSTGQWLGSWTPWYGVTSLPEGSAYLIPSGAAIVAEIHYRSADLALEDRSSLGLYFAPASLTRLPSDLVLEAVRSPRSGRDHGDAAKLSGTVRLENDSTLLALRPAVEAGVDSVAVTARQPNGAMQVLLLIRDPLEAWPTPYVLKDPVSLPAGSEISVAYRYRADHGDPPEALASRISIISQTGAPATVGRR